MERPQYHLLPRADLLAHLNTVSVDLAELHEEWAMVENARIAARVHAYASSPAETESGRAREADRHSLPNTQAVNEVRAKIQSLTETRDLLRTLLNG